MAALTLTPSQRKDQRALAHHLHPVVMIGGEGLTPSVVGEIDLALNSHGLIKVRVLSDDRTARESMFVQLSEQLSAAPIQHIGKLLVLWRPMPPKQKSEREGRGAGPKVVKVLKFSKSGNHRPQVKKIKVLGNQRIAAGGQVKRDRKRLSSVKKATTN